MREIKFRAWDKKEKVIIQSDYKNYWLLQGSDGKTRVFYNGKLYESDDYEIMQYTGLKDKNGKEIYEGDILKFSVWANGYYKNEKDYNYTNKVVNYNNIRTAYILDDEVQWNLGIYSNIEVIGNIYENPELTNSPKTKEIK